MNRELIYLPRLTLRAWERAARALGEARRTGKAEARLDRRVAQLEREIVIFLWKEVRGHRLHKPKLPRAYSGRRALSARVKL